MLLPQKYTVHGEMSFRDSRPRHLHRPRKSATRRGARSRPLKAVAVRPGEPHSTARLQAFC